MLIFCPLKMRSVREMVDGLKPAIAMVIVHIAYTGSNILYKLAANQGLNLRTIIAYRWIISSLLLVPLALIVERKSRPKLTRVVLFQAFLCGLFGGTASQNMYLEAIALTSATFVAAMSNLLPAITLILALTFRLENLEIKTRIGQAKLAGTIVGTGGAMVLTLYKGPIVNLWSINAQFSKHIQHQNSYNSSSGTHILGSFFAMGGCITYALWLTVQTRMSKIYPCHYSSAALMSVMASLQSVILSLCMERNWSQWKLGWNLMLLTVFYTGILIAGLVVTIIAWCVRTRGPVFVANFNPLSLLFTAIVSSLVLNEKLHLGSILGAGLIVCGLYIVLWGKGKEMNDQKTTENSSKFEMVEVVTDGDQDQLALNTSDVDPSPKKRHDQNKLKQSAKQDKNNTN